MKLWEEKCQGKGTKKRCERLYVGKKLRNEACMLDDLKCQIPQLTPLIKSTLSIPQIHVRVIWN